MKKNLFLLTIALISTAFVCNKTFAQIKFESGTWSQIKAKAKAENKLIFLDAYTTWCGPCKWMARNVFTNDTVAQFYNATFVNAKIDMEAGEGIDIAKEYNVRVYPSLLYIDGNGDLVHRAAGSIPAKDFIQLGKDAWIPEKQFGILTKKYNNGERSSNFITTYLDALNNVGLKTDEPLTEYFKTQKEEDFTQRANWNIIYNFVNDYKSKEFNYLLNNTDLFTKKYFADSVNNKIYDVILNKCFDYIYSRNEDSIKYLPFKEEITKINFVKKEELLLDADLVYYEKKRDYDNYSKTACQYIDKYQSNNTDVLNNISYSFYRSVKDKSMLAKAESWAKKAYEIEPHPEFSMDTYSCLLFINGKKEEAIKLAKQAIEIIKSDKLKYNQKAIESIEENIAVWSN